MKVAVIKYNAGNVFSVTAALKRLGVDPVITSDPDRILSADRVIFPGVGEAGSAMAYLRAHGIDHVVPRIERPFLGICLGLHLLCRHSEENDTTALGLFPLDVKRFPPRAKVPHMGWNTIEFQDSPLFAGLKDPVYVYFVHSFYAGVGEPTIATTHYIHRFSSALNKGNFFAVQFHPEKSGKVGERVLKNFLELE